MRTKTGSLPLLKPSFSEPSSTTPSREIKRGKRYALEAQLENATDDNPLTLTLVHLATTKGFNSTSLNWEIVVAESDGKEGKGEMGLERPVLGPGDIRQVCFLVEEKDLEDNGEGDKMVEGKDERERESELVDGRLIFGVLNIGWRGAMGNRGFLSTGNLGIRIQ